MITSVWKPIGAQHFHLCGNPRFPVFKGNGFIQPYPSPKKKSLTPQNRINLNQKKLTFLEMFGYIFAEVTESPSTPGSFDPLDQQK